MPFRAFSRQTPQVSTTYVSVEEPNKAGMSPMCSCHGGRGAGGAGRGARLATRAHGSGAAQLARTAAPSLSASSPQSSASSLPVFALFVSGHLGFGTGRPRCQRRVGACARRSAGAQTWCRFKSWCVLFADPRSLQLSKSPKALERFIRTRRFCLK